jgi:hypothetical protein
MDHYDHRPKSGMNQTDLQEILLSTLGFRVCRLLPRVDATPVHERDLA